MARTRRIDMPDGWYQVSARGLEQREIFRDDEDRSHLRDLLSQLPGRFGVRLHAWVLMDNHFHLQIETPEMNLRRRCIGSM